MSLFPLPISLIRSASQPCSRRVPEAAFGVPHVEEGLAVDVDRDMLLSALGNLLQNAFKFTKPGTDVSWAAYAVADRILIEVEDHCGGLPRKALRQA